MEWLHQHFPALQTCWGRKHIEACKVFGCCGCVACRKKGKEVAALSLRPLKLCAYVVVLMGCLNL